MVAVGIPDHALEGGVQGHLPGHAPDGQVAVDRPPARRRRPDRRAGERPGRVVLDVEEVVGAQVVVAVLVAGVDAAGLDGHRNLGVDRVLGQLQGAAEVGELATDLGHGHVAHGEAEPGVADVEDVGTDGRILHAVYGPAGYGGLCHGNSSDAVAVLGGGVPGPLRAPDVVAYASIPQSTCTDKYPPEPVESGHGLPSHRGPRPTPG